MCQWHDKKIMLLKEAQMINNQQKVLFLLSEFLDYFCKYILEWFGEGLQLHCIDHEGLISEKLK